jgi:SulP family sulfate permease
MWMARAQRKGRESALPRCAVSLWTGSRLMSPETAPRGSMALDTAVRGWRAAFAPAQRLPTHRPPWLAHDAIAGVRLAACGIPVSLACASLAGVPPQ